MSELEIVEVLRDFNVLNLEPNDVIVFRTPHRINRDQEQWIRDMVKRVFPDHECLVLSDGADIAVARRH